MPDEQSQMASSRPKPSTTTPSPPPSETSPLLLNRTPPTPGTRFQAPTSIPHTDTNASWPTVAGLPPRRANDEYLVIFRRAIGINHHLPSQSGTTMEEGRKSAIGIYRTVIKQQRRLAWQYCAVDVLVYFCHFAQIIIGASLTALGPTAASVNRGGVVITVLGATNTVIAGLLALINGQGLPERLRKNEIGFRKLQDWIEETEALLAVGIIGRNRIEVDLLVEIAFKKYNAAKASEENNRPGSYVRQPEERSRNASRAHGDEFGEDSDESGSSGNAVVRLNY